MGYCLVCASSTQDNYFLVVWDVVSKIKSTSRQCFLRFKTYCSISVNLKFSLDIKGPYIVWILRAHEANKRHFVIFLLTDLANNW